MIGQSIGPYQVVAKLGEGGMGEVYRARDSRLNRDVAIKVLPDLVANDPERLARFRREAQVLASLNHPNIAALYGFEDANATHALVMELVEGPTLAEKIAAGPIALDEALHIARQIAEALEAAHDQGIIHRDLKPANIKVRDDGTVKVLDFGLAKALAPDMASGPPGLSLSPTLSVQATMRGTILGTAAYMSPEQARGKAVDRRTDIWAFGCVLYEMLTGKQCFDAGGDSVSDAIAAILKNEPDWNALPAETPPHIRTLLRRCLQKDLSRRLPHIGIARIDISEPPPEAVPVQPAQPVAAPQPRSNRAVAVAWGVAALVTIAAAALGAMVYLAPKPAPVRSIRFALTPPDGWRLQTAPSGPGGGAMPLSVSPDGTKLALVLANSEGKNFLWIRPLDTFTPTMLAGTEGAEAPFWSPDGRSLGFFAGGKLKRIEISGGPPLVLCDATPFRSGTWSPDGTIVFSTYTGTLSKVSQAGGVPAAATVQEKGDNIHLRPTFLPDGRHFYYRVTNGGGYIASLDSPGRKLLFKNPDASNVAFSRGHVLFLRGTTLMAQPFDAGKLELAGEPVPIADQIQTAATPPVGIFAASDNGTLVYQTGADNAGKSRLAWFDRSGKPLGMLGDPATYGDVQLSRDGKRAAVSVAASTPPDLWIFDIARGIRSRFTFDPAADNSPVWSHDGSRIVFASSRKGHLDLYQKESNGAGAEELVFADDHDKYPLDWSPDDRFVLYQTATPQTRADLWILPMSGDRKPFPFAQSPFAEVPGVFSPDGRWIAYASDESGIAQIYVAPFPGPGGKWQVSQTSGTAPRWNRNGKEIFYLTQDGSVFAATVNGEGPAFQVGEVRELFKASSTGARWAVDVSPDGQRFLINTRTEVSSATFPFSVVLNWADGGTK